MNRIIKMLISIVLILAGIAALYVGGNMLYGTLTDYKPAPSESLEIKNPVSAQPTDSVFTFFNWNIGYSALGDQEDFFFDGGKLVRPSKERVEENMKGITAAIAANPADFILIQEIDVSSKRSHYIDELDAIVKVLPAYSFCYAKNYLVNYVPAPLNRPWNAYGKVDAGLSSFSKYQPVEATRYSLPGEFGWPKKVFWLDRCLLLFRYNLPNGKQLVVINQHLEAYDEGGIVKKQEMSFMKDLLLKEYEKGNYVIVGGDWNQCPPDFDYQHFMKDTDSSYVQLNVASDYIPGWTWAFDSSTPTNRKLAAPYEPGKTFTTLIDFYLVSPNVKVLAVKGINLDFKHSDHQPVMMRVGLD